MTDGLFNAQNLYNYTLWLHTLDIRDSHVVLLSNSPDFPSCLRDNYQKTIEQRNRSGWNFSLLFHKDSVHKKTLRFCRKKKKITNISAFFVWKRKKTKPKTKPSNMFYNNKTNLFVYHSQKDNDVFLLTWLNCDISKSNPMFMSQQFIY